MCLIDVARAARIVVCLPVRQWGSGYVSAEFFRSATLLDACVCVRAVSALLLAARATVEPLPMCATVIGYLLSFVRRFSLFGDRLSLLNVCVCMDGWLRPRSFTVSLFLSFVFACCGRGADNAF